jgi:hypothetical protein
VSRLGSVGIADQRLCPERRESGASICSSVVLICWREILALGRPFLSDPAARGLRCRAGWGSVNHPGVIVGIHKEFLMKKLSQKSVLLFGAMLAVCAFVPSLASAASWSPINSAHTLSAPGLSFLAHTGPLGAAGWSCAGVSLGTHVANANTLAVTSASFTNCMGSGGTTNCTVTEVGTGFPWQATATATSNIQIHNVVVDMLFEATPGNPSACAAAGAKILLTGTLTGGSWRSATNTAVLTNAQGLTAHYLGLGTSSTTTLNGTISDNAGTLRMLD